jgi:hypothetical protein
MGAMRTDSSPTSESQAGHSLGEPAVFTFSWILWCSSSPDDQASVYHEVNRIFSKQFSFYPELEWKTRYPPPQGHEIRGAWRDNLNRAFAFLLDNPGMKPPPGTVPLLLHCAGAKNVLQGFLPQIDQLKDELKEKSGRQTVDKQLQGRLKQADTSKSLRRLIALTGLITGVINALALYLRRLQAPTVDLPWFSRIYNLLLAAVYIGAIVLLLLFILLCLFYMGKMGYLLIKKL